MLKRLPRACVSLVLIGPFGGILFSQQTPAPSSKPEDTVFRVTTTLVQVDAVVTDASGKQVTDLGPSDFELKVDDKAQPLSKFSYVRLSRDAVRAPEAAAKRNADQPPNFAPSTVRREQVRSSILLVVDDLGLSWESTAFVRRALKKFVNEQLEPDQVAAIYQTGRRSGIFQQFTSDKRLLLAAVERLRWNPMNRASLGAVALITPLTDADTPAYLRGCAGCELHGGNSSTGDRPADGRAISQYDRGALSEVESRNYEIGTLGSVNEILRALYGLPGRKSMVLFSEGINLSPSLQGGDERLITAARNLIENANRSGTVIHAIDARGLQTGVIAAGDNPAMRGVWGPLRPDEIATRLRNLRDKRSWDLFESQSGLEFIAQMTGGSAFINSNDMNWALGRVMEDQRGYYLLGFQPDPSMFQPKAGGNYHSIRVRLTRKGMSVRSRTGFFGTTDEEMQPGYSTPAAQIRAAMLSPFQATGIGLRITPVYLKSTTRGPLVRNLVYVDPADLHFELGTDGKRSANLHLLAVAAGADNKILGSANTTTLVQIPAEKFVQTMRDGLLMILEVQVKQPGGYQIRIGLRDSASAKIGSAGQYLEIPDLKKGRLTLSSVVIDEPGAAPEGARFLGIMPAKRQFHAGNQMEFFSILNNVHLKPGAGSTDVEAQVRILREGQTIFSGPAKLTALEGDREWAVRGTLHLAEAMSPGEYYLQVSAIDHVSKRNNLASTWTDFELIPE